MPRWSKAADAAGAADPRGNVAAPMPGRITTVHVKEGDTIAAGE